MRRTKEWWARLNPHERAYLVYFERYQGKGGRSAYLPDDCSECGVCGCPTLGSSPCEDCSDRYDKLIKKGDHDVKGRAAASSS